MFHVQDSVISTINVKVDKLADSVATFKASLEYTHTHTQKKRRGGIYRPQNRNSRALRKIWMKSKLPWVFRKIPKNGVPREPKRTEL